MKTKIAVRIFKISLSLASGNSFHLGYSDQVLEGSRCDFERGWCGWVNMVSPTFDLENLITTKKEVVNNCKI